MTLATLLFPKICLNFLFKFPCLFCGYIKGFTVPNSRISSKKIVRGLFFLLAISNKPKEAYLQQKLKTNVGIWPNPQISLMGKKYLEIGLNNKQTNVVGRKLGQNI